ncbi:MAG: hypothetical protein JNK05_21915 [Myxococcales bacterium]|nr:hypothetical protein [Myxococcales bacterium]
MKHGQKSSVRSSAAIGAALCGIAALVIAACGGSTQSNANPTTTTQTTASAASTGGEHHGEHHGQGEHHQLSPALHAMHEVLRPVWHSEPGPGRDARACEQAATLRERAGAAQTETLPADAPANSAETRAALVQAAQALVDECSGARADVNGKLTALHTAFHHTFERH